MIAFIAFEFPQGLLLALPIALALAWAVWRQRGKGFRWSYVLLSNGLRAMAFAALVFLATRPVWEVRQPPNAAARSVALLMDTSESMALEESEKTRYQQALNFTRDRLLPALKSADLPVQAMLFDQSAEAADGAKLNAATPKGKRTNLGGAIAQAIGSAAAPPLAVIALTDGIANESADNMR